MDFKLTMLRQNKCTCIANWFYTPRCLFTCTIIYCTPVYTTNASLMQTKKKKTKKDMYIYTHTLFEHSIKNVFFHESVYIYPAMNIWKLSTFCPDKYLLNVYLYRIRIICFSKVIQLHEYIISDLIYAAVWISNIQRCVRTNVYHPDIGYIYHDNYYITSEKMNIYTYILIEHLIKNCIHPRVYSHSSIYC